jgi:Glyoxalase-like domain
MTLALDHLAVSAETLDAGVAWVEAALRTDLTGGGRHDLMGTHNRLLGLGDLYLEVIAIDPDAPRPAWPRWFDLDRFRGPPRLTNWVCATHDLDAALKDAPKDAGAATALSRGDFRWRMAVPQNGRLPFDEAFPALIEWQGEHHPARALPDSGIRLTRLEIAHPETKNLRHLVGRQLADPRVIFRQAPHVSMRATFSTPTGTRVLT